MTLKNNLSKAEKANKYRTELVEWAKTAADEDILGHAGLTVIGAFATIIIVAAGAFAAFSFVAKVVIDAVYSIKDKHNNELEDEEEYDNKVKFEDIQNS